MDQVDEQKVWNEFAAPSPLPRLNGEAGRALERRKRGEAKLSTLFS